MSRVRETLRRADTARDQLSAPASDHAGRSEGGTRMRPEDQEIPFIEVGGSGPPLEASASVLAATPRSAPRPQPREAEFSQGQEVQIVSYQGIMRMRLQGGSHSVLRF
jgi:hypothetical protein